MEDEVKDLIKTTIKYDFILLISIAIIIAMLFNMVYSLIYILGLVVSMINFIVNSIVLNYELNKKQFKSPILNIVSLLIRTSIICMIAIVLFTYNKYYLIVYIIGVIMHFIAIILYATKLRRI